jgi:activator of HSP90 ATPase
MNLQSMIARRMTRRTWLLGLASLPSAFALPAPAAAADTGPTTLDTAQEISRSAVAIHQEIMFAADRKRVYHALTDAASFDRVVRLGDAVRTGMVTANAARSRIGRRAGAGFSLFGGYITGLQVELLRGQRLVQVWRTASWDPGQYSLASFQLADDGSGCRLLFDHRGFPPGEASHLAAGWHANYWQPLAQALAQA